MLQDTVAVHTGNKKVVCCHMSGLTIRLGECHFTRAEESRQSKKDVIYKGNNNFGKQKKFKTGSHRLHSLHSYCQQCRYCRTVLFLAFPPESS